MSITQAFILGLVEGITEFLPISSTAHLILAGQLLGITPTPFLSYFQVFIQSGAMVAVVILYWKIFRQHADLLIKLLVAFFPTAIIALLTRNTIKSLFFESNGIIAASLIIVGAIFLIMEFFIQKNHINLTKSLERLTYKDAIIIGLIQSCALVPGVSRAGAVMLAMMLMKYKRTDAALFSFYLAVPTILGAGLAYSFFFYPTPLQAEQLTALATGSVVACLSAYLFMRWLIGYLQKHTLVPFALYRIGLGLLIITAARFFQ